MGKKQLATSAHPRRRAKRMQVLNEAAQALNRQGVSQTSLAEVAKHVGISRAALYYYFEDQQDLVFQCYVRSCEQLALRLSEATHRASNALEVINTFVAGMLGEGEPEFAALSEPAFLRADQRDTILGLYEALRASVVHTLDEGARRGDLRSCHSELVASAIIGLISWMPAARRWRRVSPLSDRDLVEAISATLLDGIAAERSAAFSYVPFALSTMGQLSARQVFDQAAMAAARQEAILVAASWLFNLKGVDATSLEEIAVRVGVTKKVIYHNVRDKQTLVADCYRRAFRFYEDVGARMRAYEGPRIDALSASAHALAEGSLSEDITPFRPFTGFEARPEKGARRDAGGRPTPRGTYLEAYNQGRAEGSVREMNARAVLAILPGLVEWLPKWFDAFGEADRARAPHELAELFRLGLRPL